MRTHIALRPHIKSYSTCFGYLSRPIPSTQQFTDPEKGRAAKYITAGIGAGSWSRIASWLQKFKAYLSEVASKSGRATISKRMVRHNGLALEFCAQVADEAKGRTRVGAAIRAINFVRNFLGVQPLSDDPRVKLLQEGVLRSDPHLPKGAPPFPPPAVIAIVSRWGS